MLRSPATAVLAAALLLMTPVLAAEAWADPGRGKGGPQGGQGRHGGGDSISINISIGGDDRAILQDYFGGMARRGHCPPGLAKKNNGCMPPGQAKQWAKGRRLGPEVIFHNLPPDIYGRLHVPAGYRYVRVGADILMIAIGTGMVVDAVEDLMRM
jgi:hypothetical protein